MKKSGNCWPAYSPRGPAPSPLTMTIAFGPSSGIRGRQQQCYKCYTLLHSATFFDMKNAVLALSCDLAIRRSAIQGCGREGNAAMQNAEYAFT